MLRLRPVREGYVLYGFLPESLDGQVVWSKWYRGWSFDWTRSGLLWPYIEAGVVECPSGKEDELRAAYDAYREYAADRDELVAGSTISERGERAAAIFGRAHRVVEWSKDSGRKP